MDDQQLNRNLQSVGMCCFVKYFGEFDNNALPNRAVAEILRERESYTPASCSSRVSKSRSIIRAGRARDALLMIAGSAKVCRRTAEKAKELADGLGGG